MHGWKMTQRFSVCGTVVCAKVMQLCSNNAQMEGKEKASVHTSKGWCQNFHKCMSLQNKYRIGQSASAQPATSMKCPEHFNRMTTPQQVCSLNVTGPVCYKIATIYSFPKMKTSPSFKASKIV
jgi:hypothetical protein